MCHSTKAVSVISRSDDKAAQTQSLKGSPDRLPLAGFVSRSQQATRIIEHLSPAAASASAGPTWLSRAWMQAAAQTSSLWQSKSQEFCKLCCTVECDKTVTTSGIASKWNLYRAGVSHRRSWSALEYRPPLLTKGKARTHDKDCHLQSIPADCKRVMSVIMQEVMCVRNGLVLRAKNRSMHKGVPVKANATVIFHWIRIIISSCRTELSVRKSKCEIALEWTWESMQPIGCKEA